MTRPDATAALASVVAATAAPGQPQALFAALDQAMGATIGPKV